MLGARSCATMKCAGGGGGGGAAGRACASAAPGWGEEGGRGVGCVTAGQDICATMCCVAFRIQDIYCKHVVPYVLYILIITLALFCMQ